MLTSSKEVSNEKAGKSGRRGKQTGVLEASHTGRREVANVRPGQRDGAAHPLQLACIDKMEGGL